MTVTSEDPFSGDAKYLNEEEMRLYFQTALATPSLRNRALCLLVYFTGCRPSEAILLRPKNLHPDRDMVEMPTLKQRTNPIPTRFVAVPDYLMEMLLSLCDGSKPIIGLGRTQSYKIIKNCMNLAGLSGRKACPRGLRHTYTTGNLKIKTPLSDIQKRLGHSRLESTMRYMDLMDDDARQYAEKFWDFATGGVQPTDEQMR